MPSTSRVCLFFVAAVSIWCKSDLSWVFLLHTAAHECCSGESLSAILIRDKNQSSTPENSISLMRYEFSSKHKSEIVCCFQTNPLKVIWSSAANYRAAFTGLLPPPCPTYPPTAPLSVRLTASLCFRSLFGVTGLLLRSRVLTGRRCGLVMWRIRLPLVAVLVWIWDPSRRSVEILDPCLWCLL